MSHYSFQPSDRAQMERLDAIIKQQKEIIALLREQMGKPAEKKSEAETIVITASDIYAAIDRMQQEGRL